jgi:hypothetical protein
MRSTAVFLYAIIACIACAAAQSPVKIVDATFKYKEFDVVRKKLRDLLAPVLCR